MIKSSIFRFMYKKYYLSEEISSLNEFQYLKVRVLINQSNKNHSKKQKMNK